jgi:hypothetical protein
MKNERMLDVIGLIDEKLVNRVANEIKPKKRMAKNIKIMAIAASFILCIIGISHFSIVEASINQIEEWVSQIGKDYDDENLAQFKMEINQTRVVDGLNMNIAEMAFEDNLIIAKCSFAYEDAKNDLVQTSDMPYDVKIILDGKIIATISSKDDRIRTLPYVNNQGETQVLYTINCEGMLNLHSLVGKKTIISFYYPRGVLKNQSYDFSVKPSKIYSNVSKSLKESHQIKGFGNFEIDGFTKQVLFLSLDIKNNLVAPKNAQFDYRLIDENGTEYELVAQTKNKQYFLRPDESKNLKLEVVLTEFNQEEEENKESVIGSYDMERILKSN